MPPDSSSPSALRRRVISFLTVVLSILLAGNAVVCATWSYFWNLPGMPIWVVASFALSAGFVATSILGRVTHGAFLNFAYRVTALWLGFLNYFLFASFLAWILFYATHLDRQCIGIISYGSAIAVTLYGFANAAMLRVTRVNVSLRNLPETWRGRSLALVTDMHLGNMRGAGFTRRVVEKLKSLGVETVLISGDMFDGPEADFDALVQPWKTISDVKKIFFVTGNHEEFTDRTKFIKAVSGAGIRVLNNEKVELDGLQIAGVHDEEIHDPEVFRSILQSANLDKSRASILLAHQPKYLHIPEESGISLMLCGHTHGGQFWPWIYIARRVHQKFNHGLQRFKNLQVFTSYGAGTWGAPMRVGTKPEIILITLEPDSAFVSSQ